MYSCWSFLVCLEFAKNQHFIILNYITTNTTSFLEKSRLNYIIVYQEPQSLSKSIQVHPSPSKYIQVHPGPSMSTQCWNKVLGFMCHSSSAKHDFWNAISGLYFFTRQVPSQLFLYSPLVACKEKSFANMAKSRLSCNSALLFLRC